MRVGAGTAPLFFFAPERMDQDRRYIKQTGLESRIAAIAAPVAESLGYRLVRVRVSSLNGMTVQVMAEDADGQFSITDCERLSHDLSPVLDADAQARFQALKVWRATVAREHNLPAYVVFHDATLAQMAEQAPATLDALAGISGVGVKKLQAYGADLLDVMRGARPAA